MTGTGKKYTFVPIIFDTLGWWVIRFFFLLVENVGLFKKDERYIFRSETQQQPQGCTHTGPTNAT